MLRSAISHGFYTELPQNLSLIHISEKTIAAKDTSALSSINNGDLVTYEMEGSAYEPVSYTHLDVYKRQM